MTKPIITIGIAGGTGAGKVRHDSWRHEARQGNAAIARCIIHTDLSPFAINICLQSTLAKSVFDALGGEANVTYLVHDSYYKGML